MAYQEVLSTMEPSDEIKRFLQEIAQVRQDAHGRKLGGFQEASSSGEEGDYKQVMAVPGGTVVTEVWAKLEKGIWSTSKKEAPGFTRYYARWRFPTVALWRRLGSTRQNIFTQELKVWRIFLTETSLIRGPLTFSENLLSDESFGDILGFAPAMIPTALVRLFLQTTTLSQQELYQIGKECMELWREGGSVRDPHPLLEEVINAINIHERFGIPAWSTIGEIPIRTYAVVRKALECYNESMSLNQKEDSVRRHVQQMAGVRPPTFGLRG
jgi:hypothetical protein